MAWNNISNNKNITIQKFDISKSVALLDKDKYLEGMSQILNINANLECFNLLFFCHVMGHKVCAQVGGGGVMMKA